MSVSCGKSKVTEQCTDVYVCVYVNFSKEIAKKSNKNIEYSIEYHGMAHIWEYGMRVCAIEKAHDNNDDDDERRENNILNMRNTQMGKERKAKRERYTHTHNVHTHMFSFGWECIEQQQQQWKQQCIESKEEKKAMTTMTIKSLKKWIEREPNYWMREQSLV